MFFTILLFVFILSILVLSHEFGHFITAKKFGMRVDEFGFGFPPKLFGIRKGETLYSFNLFPVGGFVKIYGEDGENRKDSKSFSSNSIWRRSLVILAGVAMNFLVAYILFTVGHMIGTPTAFNSESQQAGIENVSVQILQIVPDSPAEASDLKLGDKILSITTQEEKLVVGSADNVKDFINNNQGQSFIFSIDRGGDIETIIVNSRVEFNEKEGSVGIQFIDAGIVKYSWYAALWQGVETTVNTTIAILLAFGSMISNVVTTGSLPADVAGPIGIAVFTGTVKGLGLVYVLQFIALISINLAILNIIPFPALDGGRLLFLIIEKIKGSPVNKKIESFAHAAGFALLILLIIVITFNDINKFF